MATFSLDGYFKLLFDVSDETGDFVLEDDEYIRLVAIRPTDKSGQNVITKYFRHKNEILEFISKYKYNFNLYIGLATTNGQGGTKEFMYKRRVLMLDFDRKDYLMYKDVSDFSTHIKGRIRTLFTHAVVDTGNGYHYYIGINQLKNNQRIADVNRQLSEILGADTKAALPTQIARLPTSMNLKDKEHQKPVVIVSNNLEGAPDKFKRTNILKIEHLIEDNLHNQELLNKHKNPQTPAQEFTKVTSYYCIESMLSEGVREGERNFCLGRITNYLRDIKGWTEYNALKEILDWNLRCQPPKDEKIVERDFKAYWNGDYKLLGCTVPNESDQRTVCRFCDKSMCNAVFENTKNDKVEGLELLFDNRILDNTHLRKLSGNHYLILSVMDAYDKPMKRADIVQSLTARKTGKCCISDCTLRKDLNELIEKKLIEFGQDKLYTLKTFPNYNRGYIRYYYSAAQLLVNEIITPTEYLVYLCLVRNLQNNTKVDYDTLSDNLNIDKSNISKAIHGLCDAGSLRITKDYNKRGQLYNVYTIVA